MLMLATLLDNPVAKPGAHHRREASKRGLEEEKRAGRGKVPAGGFAEQEA
jgi:hypothetical protein